MEEDPSSLQRSTPNPLQTTCLPPTTTTTTSTARNRRRRRGIQGGWNSRLLNAKQYLVHWKDYPSCTDWTWEPESNITHVPEAIKDFHTKNPSAPRRLPLDTRTILFWRIPNDNIPVHIPQRMRSSMGRIFNWEDGIFKEHNSDWDAHPKMGVMLWMNTFSFFHLSITGKGLSKKLEQN